MRRSRRVGLAFLGTVTLVGCSPDCDDPQRFNYRSRTVCVDDWGVENCTEPGPAEHCARGHWYGPRYSSYVRLPSGERAWTGTRATPGIDPISGKRLGQQAIARGGFGSTSRRFLVGG